LNQSEPLELNVATTKQVQVSFMDQLLRHKMKTQSLGQEAHMLRQS
jgi:hypothetical protein